MAAAVTLLTGTTFNTNSGTKTCNGSPSVDDLIVIVTAHSGNTSATAPTDNAVPSSTYVRINAASARSSADLVSVWIRNALIPSAGIITFTHAPGTTTGGGLAVLRVTGVAATGAGAARQSAVSNNAAAGTPGPAFSSAALTGNAVIGAVLNATSPATLTPRGTPAYTERADVGYSTPTTGLEVQSIDSGETGTTISWGSASASAFGAIVVEINAAAANVGAASGAGAATAVGQAIAASVGASAATGTAAAVGTGYSLAFGTSSSQGDAQAVLEAVIATAGGASGAGSAAAISSLNSTIVGSSAGVGGAAAVGASTRAAAGTSAGTGAAAAHAVALASASGTAGGVSITMGNATAIAVSLGWLVASNSSERWTRQQPSGVITDHNGDPILDENAREITDGLTEVWAARSNQATVWTEAA